METGKVKNDKNLLTCYTYLEKGVACEIIDLRDYFRSMTGIY